MQFAIDGTPDQAGHLRSGWDMGRGTGTGRGRGRGGSMSFSMEITNFARNGISESRPISKSCQRVTSVFDSKIGVRSSEREQRILTASRSARWALLHREREREV